MTVSLRGHDNSNCWVWGEEGEGRDKEGGGGGKRGEEERKGKGRGRGGERVRDAPKTAGLDPPLNRFGIWGRHLGLSPRVIHF